MSDAPASARSAVDALTQTASIVAAYVRNNPLASAELPQLIGSVHAALAALTAPQTAETVEAPAPKPAVNPKRSVFPDFIVSLEDGKRYKSLKRHLMSRYNMTPQQYREKWGLPAAYPMVAPNYAQRRAELAVRLGLGRKRKSEVVGNSEGGAPTTDTSADAEERSMINDASSASPKKRGRPKRAVAALAT